MLDKLDIMHRFSTGKLDIMHRFSTGKTYPLSVENMLGKLDIVHRFSTGKTYLLCLSVWKTCLISSISCTAFRLEKRIYFVYQCENMLGKLDIMHRFSTGKTYLLSEENMLDMSRFVRTAMV